jgi:ADP-ribosylglycohydrolase
LVEDLPSRLHQDRDTALHAIAWAGSSRPEFSRPIITPFVVPTVLAALWVVLRHESSWPDAVAEAIHLGGDVDTLGAIVGALMGARLGHAAIPAHLADRVLGVVEIRHLARQYSVLTTAEMR